MNKKPKDIISFLIIGILLVILFIQYNCRIPCIFHEVTGLHCPGCGGTRAVISLMKLDLHQALRYNMLVVMLIPLFIILFTLKNIFKVKIPEWVWYILIVILVVYGVLRNIPYFSFLAPTDI